MTQKTIRISLLVIRIILGVLFLLSGVGKLINGADAQYLVELLSTEFYWLIEYSSLIVTTTSVVEIVLGVFPTLGKIPEMGPGRNHTDAPGIFFGPLLVLLLGHER